MINYVVNPIDPVILPFTISTLPPFGYKEVEIPVPAGVPPAGTIKVWIKEE